VVAEETWNASFTITVDAPVLSIGKFIIDDTTGGNVNGNIDPGETVQIIVKSWNQGHSDCSGAVGQLTSTSSWITIGEPSYSIGDIPAESESDAVFTVTVDDNAPIGAAVDFTYQLTSGEYSVENTYSRTIGLVFENFESGNFSKFPWATTSTWPWTIYQYGGYEGNYSARSGDIGNSTATNLMIYYTCVADDSISFYKCISSETDHDFLNFYIDDTLMGQWSGFADWERVCYPVTPGLHLFKWEYAKDEENKQGMDLALIDYVVFPATLVTTCNPGNDTTICRGETYQCEAAASNYTSLLWTTSGTGTFDEPILLNPVYYPSQQDYNNGSVILTLTAYSNLPCGDIIRSFTLTFTPQPGVPEMPQGPTYVDLYYSTTSDYTTQPASDVTSYLWNLEPADAGSIAGDQTAGTVQWNAAYLGMASISVQGINDCGESNPSEAINVEVVNTVGTPLLNPDDAISIYPNPNNGKFMILLNNGITGNGLLSVIDTYGNLIIKDRPVQIGSHSQVRIDLDNVVDGVYYMMLKTDDRQEVRRFVIIN
jgi:hypothetical protein